MPHTPVDCLTGEPTNISASRAIRSVGQGLQAGGPDYAKPSFQNSSTRRNPRLGPSAPSGLAGSGAKLLRTFEGGSRSRHSPIFLS